jgi:L-asparaginase II
MGRARQGVCRHADRFMTASKPSVKRRTAAVVPPTNPVLVEATREPAVESRHAGAVAVVDAAGRTVAAWGDVERPIFPRSAIKPLQALLLVECGAADAFKLGARELALACASHGGEPAHVATVTAWLASVGLTEGDLECGAHAPSAEAAALALLRAGTAPNQCHNNCSGKHAGMLSAARFLRIQTRGYIKPEHRIQEEVRRVLEDLTGLALADAPRGIDGCGIPAYAMPLKNVAHAMARFAAPDELPPARAGACRRLAQAMAAHPFLVAGTGRFCTALIQRGQGSILVKSGAEGVFTAALPKLGLGVALKIDDGARRASQVAIAAVLRHLGALDDEDIEALSTFARPRLTNWRGVEIGVVRPAEGWLA